MELIVRYVGIPIVKIWTKLAKMICSKAALFAFIKMLVSKQNFNKTLMKPIVCFDAYV